jgi:hypothetical protein
MAFKHDQRSDFMIKYGPLDHAREAMKTGDIINRETAMKRMERDSPEEHPAAFDSYFNHALHMAHPKTPERDSWHLRHLFRTHPEHLQAHHLDAAYDAPEIKDTVRLFAVRHANASQTLLRRAMGDEIHAVREEAVKHANAPDDVIIKGLHDKASYDVRNAAHSQAFIKGTDWIQKHNVGHLLP